MPAMRVLLSLALLFTAGQMALANEPAGTVSAQPQAAQEAMGPLSPDDGRLDSLYQQLKKERHPESARAIAEQIRNLYSISGSATVDMLMKNALIAMGEKRYGAALDFLDQVTLLAPDYAEGWNRRAALHYLMGNSGKAMADTARALALEPRHIGALSGLAGILQQTGRDEDALKAWEAYLSFYPADREAQKQALELMTRLEGRKT